MNPDRPDEVLDVLEHMCAALEVSKRRMDVALAEAHRVRRELLGGASHAECVEHASGPLLGTIGARTSWPSRTSGTDCALAEVQFDEEGSSTTDIARLLGISRQRAGILLHDGVSRAESARTPPEAGGPLRDEPSAAGDVPGAPGGALVP